MNRRILDNFIWGGFKRSKKLVRNLFLNKNLAQGNLKRWQNLKHFEFKSFSTFNFVSTCAVEQKALSNCFFGQIVNNTFSNFFLIFVETFFSCIVILLRFSPRVRHFRRNFFLLEIFLKMANKTEKYRKKRFFWSFFWWSLVI